LFETIWHQGDIYEATPLAVPFLYNLLEANGPHDREVIAYLLCSIAEGQPPYGAKFEGDSSEAKMWRSLLSRKGMDPDAVLANERRFMNELRRHLDARSHLLIPYRSEFESANRAEG
jgi:hypothetical protein